MRHLGCGSLLLLAACSATGSAPPGVATVRAVPREAASPAPLARGETQLVVRTVSATTPGQEISGAACVAESPWSRVEFTSPARVLLPDFGAESPNVTVTCHAGAQSGSAVATPVAAWSGGAGGWPAVGISVGTGDVSGVGVGFGWFGGGAGASGGVPVTRYAELRMALN